MDLNRKYPTIPNVMTGETNAGISKPKLSRIMMKPRQKIEYIAPFFGYR